MKDIEVELIIKLLTEMLKVQKRQVALLRDINREITAIGDEIYRKDLADVMIEGVSNLSEIASTLNTIEQQSR